MSQSTLSPLIQARDKAVKRCQRLGTEEARDDMRKARGELRRAKKAAQNKWIDVKIMELESMNVTPKDAWKACYELKGGLMGHHKAATIMKMKKPDGSLARNDKENAKVFQKHLTKVLNKVDEYDPTILEEIDTIEEDPSLGLVPSTDEIKRALVKMKLDKAPGPSGITTNAFKSLGPEGLNKLQAIIEQMWNDPEFIPEEFSQIDLKVIPKTSDKKKLQDPNKWRGIALGETAAKVISSILTRRLTEHVCKFGKDEQCGCLFKKSCADATFSLKSAIQTLKEHGRSTYVLFVDLVKAFDSAHRELIWLILERYGVPKTMIDVLKKLHVDITYHFTAGKDKIKIKSDGGVKQGDNLGPILFIILMDAVAKTLDNHWEFETPDFRWFEPDANGNLDGRCKPNLRYGQNYRVQGRKFCITSSYYVDDAAYILLNRRDLENAARLIRNHYRRFGLTVHCGNKNDDAPESKTEAMLFPAREHIATPEDTADIMLDETAFFGFATTFKYLGTTFDPDLDDTGDVSRRIKKAAGLFGSMKEVLRNRSLNKKLRVRLYEATVVNIMIYGCESWALKAEDRRRLEVAHHRFIRSMLHITIYDVKDNRISNAEIRRRMGIYTLEQMLELRRARWIEKLAKMEPTRNPRKILHAWIPLPRPIGRPNQTIRISLADTLETLGTTANLKDFIPLARNTAVWGEQVETKLGLAPGTYTQYKNRSRRSNTGRRGGGNGRAGNNPRGNQNIFEYDPFGRDQGMTMHEANNRWLQEHHGAANGEVYLQTIALQTLGRGGIQTTSEDTSDS